MRKAIIYARVSTARQADDGLPVESQIEQCRAKAAALGATVVAVFRDDGVSGRTARRPAFLEAIEYCEAHRVELFVCWSTSRFARNRLDAALHKRMLQTVGTRLVYASQDFGESDDGWLAEAIIEVMDEQLSRTIAKDTRRSMRKNAEDGYWNGGVAPFGFASVADGKRRRLAVLEHEAVIVRLAARRYIDGSGCKDVAAWLNDAGLLRRGQAWSKASVRAMLTNPANAGLVRWKDGANEIVTAGAHPAILSEGDYTMIIDMMGARRARNIGGRPRSEAVFSGILRCGHCDAAMATETATGRGDVRYHYYNCRAWLTGTGCESRRVRVDLVDPPLVSAICDRVFTPDNVRALVAELRQQSSSFEVERQARIDAFAREIADVERRLRRLYESVEADAGLELADVAPRIRELRARLEQLQRAEAAVAAELAPVVRVTDADALEAVGQLRAAVESCDSPAQLRQFMEKIVKKASISGDHVTIDYWPESIVNAVGSQCEIRWLPGPTSLRTRRIVVVLDLTRRSRVG